MARVKLDIPNRENSFYEFDKRYDLDPELIFVFGSNLQGVHGAGAAKQAAMHFGAIHGQGFGLQGQSFAIPTRYIAPSNSRALNARPQIKTLPLNEIRKYVREFLDIALERQDHYFFVTPIGTGLAGYRDSDIAPMFVGAKNCWFPNTWRSFLE